VLPPGEFSDMILWPIVYDDICDELSLYTVNNNNSKLQHIFVKLDDLLSLSYPFGDAAAAAADNDD